MEKKIVVLGVSGSGKSLIGKRLADALGYPFFDGDDYHNSSNIEKMSKGIPLSDQDRFGWLSTLNALLKNHECAVVACSGLKPEYRDMLKKDLDDVSMLYLKGDFDTIWQRHQKRNGHYFKGQDMLKSQFAALIEPSQSEAFSLDISQDADAVFQQALAYIKQ
ncbi:Thermoresistant gluconokinase [Marinomonas spartinae]|uniref:gluconokinase n=1 Tax=Marinomonas spartinae TaxID=1792290 RepID=UPI000808E1FF|nr:gluconokinase, GntK/IdnK-type [Marinomonas spartinae]SBS40288.1 Thermoresistant gluconokinase [Marinomonas spartinae]